MSARSLLFARSSVALLVVVGAAAFAPAHAELAFLRMSGGTPAVLGESVVKGFENWIELDAVAWNVTAETSWTQGGGASVGKPNPGELTWTQTFDSSIPSMYSYLLSGASVPLVTVELVKDGKAGPATYVQLAMTGAYFTELAFDGDAAFGSIVFKTITQHVWPLLEDGTRDKPIKVSWDIPSGSASTSGDLAGLVAGYGPGDLSPSPVPEPSSYVFLLMGVLIVGIAARGRRLARGPNWSAASDPQTPITSADTVPTSGNSRTRLPLDI